jgi:hypothetical protein
VKGRGLGSGRERRRSGSAHMGMKWARRTRPSLGIGTITTGATSIPPNENVPRLLLDLKANSLVHALSSAIDPPLVDMSCNDFDSTCLHLSSRLSSPTSQACIIVSAANVIKSIIYKVALVSSTHRSIPLTTWCRHSE